MRQLPAGMTEHLATGTTTMCVCWKLEAKNGTTFGFTDHDRDLFFDDVTFEATSGFTGTQIESGLGFSVDNMEVAGGLSSTKLNEDDLSAGIYDAAIVEIWHVNWRDVSQRLLLRKGSLGEISRSENAFSAEIRGMTHALNQPKGRLYQYSCDAQLGDARCRVDTSSTAFKTAGTVAGTISRAGFYANGLEAIQSGWYSFGVLTFTSGQNAGQTLAVKNHFISPAGTRVDLWSGPSHDPEQGDAFEIIAGCDKTFATCREKFVNTNNFRGFPHMPGNDFVAFYPNADDAENDGSALA